MLHLTSYCSSRKPASAWFFISVFRSFSVLQLASHTRHPLIELFVQMLYVTFWLAEVALMIDMSALMLYVTFWLAEVARVIDISTLMLCVTFWLAEVARVIDISAQNSSESDHEFSVRFCTTLSPRARRRFLQQDPRVQWQGHQKRISAHCARAVRRDSFCNSYLFFFPEGAADS